MHHQRTSQAQRSEARDGSSKTTNHKDQKRRTLNWSSNDDRRQKLHKQNWCQIITQKQQEDDQLGKRKLEVARILKKKKANLWSRRKAGYAQTNRFCERKIETEEIVEFQEGRERRMNNIKRLGAVFYRNKRRRNCLDYPLLPETGTARIIHCLR